MFGIRLVPRSSTIKMIRLELFLKIINYYQKLLNIIQCYQMLSKLLKIIKNISKY